MPSGLRGAFGPSGGFGNRAMVTETRLANLSVSSVQCPRSAPLQVYDLGVVWAWSERGLSVVWRMIWAWSGAWSGRGPGHGLGVVWGALVASSKT